MGEDNRRYIRLDSVFPVEFRFISFDGKNFLSDWIQGFSRNIGKGGLCLEINNPQTLLKNLLANRQLKVLLKIEMPAIKDAVEAQACISWVKDSCGAFNKHLVGLNYEFIDTRQNNKIMFYARAKKLFIPFVLTTILALIAVISTNNLINRKLIEGNKEIVRRFIEVVQDYNAAKQRVAELSSQRRDFEHKILSLKQEIEALGEKKVFLENEQKQEQAAPEVKQSESELIKLTHEVNELNAAIESLIKEKAALEDKLIFIERREIAVNNELQQLDKAKMLLEKANFDKMYQWLLIHQNPRTGLVMSFEGDNQIADWAFIYDQSLVLQAFTIFADFERAKKILNFLRKCPKSEDGLFYNAYYVKDYSPAEYIVHCGPNIWLGIAILQYSEKNKDKEYLDLAEDIAKKIMYIQNQDKDGGIRGGPSTEWFSTEHNLDAYAFFQMLYKLTKKQQYLKAQDKILNWLVMHTYDKHDIPIMRGLGDSTIATDTYAWSIAAIGPEKLKEVGMEPDSVMEFAENHCVVDIDYLRPGGKAVKVKGFDFAPQRHLSRGGVVSSEWTAQMIISFKIMADYYRKNSRLDKAVIYEAKANNYMNNLGKMVISSPSPSGQGESCLPYATQGNVDTGHGWMTPKGKQTGSLSGTTYTIFAYYNYNPLKLRE